MKLKYPYFVTILFGIILLGSCKKQAEPIFELEYPMPFSINSGLSPFFIHVRTFDKIKSDLATQLKSRNIKMEDVTQILPHDMRVVTTDGREINYGMLNEIKVFITDRDPQGKRIEIGYVTPKLIERGNGIHLVPGIAEMSSYLDNPTFNIDLELNFREISVATEQVLYVNFAVYTGG